MIEVGPREAESEAGAPLVEVTFSILAREDIGTAALVGEFNAWSPTAATMTRTHAGFSATVWLPAGCRYRFRYLLDGERWENDWAADDYEPNGLGGDDSVVDLRQLRRGQVPTVPAGDRARRVPAPAPPGPQTTATGRMFDRDRQALADLLGGRRGIGALARASVELSGTA